jgi:hypothetical protein
MAGLAAACSDGRARQEVGSSGEFGGPADESRRCVDEQNQVVSDDFCTRSHAAGGYYPYFFYYGGRTIMSGGTAYMSGGTRGAVGAPAPGRGTVSRGGFGARGAARGGSPGA